MTSDSNLRVGGILTLLLLAGCPNSKVQNFNAPNFVHATPESRGEGLSKVQTNSSQQPAGDEQNSRKPASQEVIANSNANSIAGQSPVESVPNHLGPNPFAEETQLPPGDQTGEANPFNSLPEVPGEPTGNDPLDAFFPEASNPQEVAQPSTQSPEEASTAQELAEIAIGKLKNMGAVITSEEDGEDLAVDLALVQVDDEAANWLAKLPRLKKLNLSRTNITDEGISKLSGLDRLEFLNLSHTPVGDPGVESLAAMKGLKYLILNGTPITDKCLTHLAKSPSLEGLSVLGTTVSPAAVESMKQTKPNCTILLRSPNALNPGHPMSQPETSAPKNPSPIESSPEESPATGSAALRHRQNEEEFANHAKWEPVELDNSPKNPSAPEQCNHVTPSLSPGQLPTLPSEGPGANALETRHSDEDWRDPKFLDAVSEIYLQRGEWAKAVNVLKHALELDESNLQFRYHLGVALGRSGDLDASLAELTAASGEATAHYNVGIILFENALRESHRHFEQALLLDPELHDAKAWIRHLDAEMGKHVDVAIFPAAGFATHRLARKDSDVNP
jgi:TPR repeat/Leucine Rich repeat